MARFLGLDELFGGRHFDREIIVLCVRWYLRFKLSFRGLVEMMAERGMSRFTRQSCAGAHHYAPEFERRRKRFAQPVEPMANCWHCHDNWIWQAAWRRARLAA
jgi:transposase-like protein